ncbi:ATP-binding protein [Oceanobacillus damuensis]|uniref:ATP-binding protein n=1 Tax=Oceanobacillus damuensis TaxID=937928 RepID=UPI00083156FD|nr:ATP-binding protein [Oceanobacillus damuensis]
MKHFFTKILREPPKQSEEKEIIQAPKLAHLTSYQHVKNRALIGWIVSQFATAIGLSETERETLFFLAITSETLDDIQEEKIRELMLLASSAVDWIQAHVVIEEEMNLTSAAASSLSNETISRILNEIQTEVHKESVTSSESEKVWKVYRDVIYASTQGKFLLIDKSDTVRYKKGKLLCEVEIHERKDIPIARNLAKETFEKVGFKSSKTMSYNLIISEAITNILKHAISGKMMIYNVEDAFHVVVEDSGSGFPLNILPKTTLMSGFSTKESLGQGFTLMMKLAKQVVLETTSSGSTLILVLDREKRD